MLGVVLCTVAAGVAMAGGDDRRKGKTKKATAALVDGNGKKLGYVTLSQFRGKVTVAGRVKGIAPGFHGFHVHAVGKCEGPAFTTAGGHFAAPGPPTAATPATCRRSSSTPTAPPRWRSRPTAS